MRVEAARYTGTDDKGQQFVMTANRAIQRSSDVPLVDINGMFARLDLAQGPLLIAANQGRYNLDTQQVAIDGPVQGRRARRLPARDPRRHGRPQAAPARQRRARSPGQMRLGQFEAGQLQADLGERNGGARWRRSLENRARGGQMMAVRAIGIILATRSRPRMASAPPRSGAAEQPVSALKGHNSNAPVDVTADRIEVQDRADRAIFAGNVHVTQAELTLDTPRLTVAYSGGTMAAAASRSGGSTRPAEWSSTARRKPRKGDFGIYDLDRKLITLIGNVQLDRGQNQVNGQRLVIDLDSGPGGGRRRPAGREPERRPGHRPLHRAATQQQLTPSERSRGLRAPAGRRRGNGTAGSKCARSPRPMTAGRCFTTSRSKFIAARWSACSGPMAPARRPVFIRSWAW